MKTLSGLLLLLAFAQAPLAPAAQAQQPQSVFIEDDMVRGNTGKPLDDKGIRGVVIELSDGQKLPMRYGGHPPRNSVDYFWAVGWVIPEGYPTGSLYYKVVATDLQGHTQTWQSFQDPRSKIEVIAGTVQYSAKRRRRGSTDRCAPRRFPLRWRIPGSRLSSAETKIGCSKAAHVHILQRYRVVGVGRDDRARPHLLGVRHCGGKIGQQRQAELQGVMVGLKIHDLVLPEAGAENEGIVPAHPIPVLTVEDVVSRPTGQRIVAGVPGEDVIAGSAREHQRSG
jgi:hypothetical protein